MRPPTASTFLLAHLCGVPAGVSGALACSRPRPQRPRLAPKSCCEGEIATWVVTPCLPGAESCPWKTQAAGVSPLKSLLQKHPCAPWARQHGQQGCRGRCMSLQSSSPSPSDGGARGRGSVFPDPSASVLASEGLPAGLPAGGSWPLGCGCTVRARASAGQWG